mgnify:CR=1 FL=1
MNTKVRYSGIQTIFQGLKWSDCCHFLSLCSIAEEVNDKPIDLIEIIRMALDNKLIDEEFTVLDNCGLLCALTGKSWVQSEVKTLPEIILDNEYTEAIWYNKRTRNLYCKRRRYHYYRTKQSIYIWGEYDSNFWDDT